MPRGKRNIELCKYWHGEEELPEKYADNWMYMYFWEIERLYFSAYSSDKNKQWKSSIKPFLEDYPEFNALFSSLPEDHCAMIVMGAYRMFNMNPMSTADFLLYYGNENFFKCLYFKAEKTNPYDTTEIRSTYCAKNG